MQRGLLQDQVADENSYAPNTIDYADRVYLNENGYKHINGSERLSNDTKHINSEEDCA